MQPRWDLFCRVVDNFGDIGVCWRLAADLARRGIAVRLWCDDASALAWMAPQGAAGVQVCDWDSAGAAEGGAGDVVIEALGCDPPAAFVAAMAARSSAPVWINLEYLSAEPYVERSHGLASPQSHGPGAGLTKWFFYPGFSAATGGLLRETDLMQRQASFDAAGWRAAHGLPSDPAQPLVSLFCYANPQLPALLDDLQRQGVCVALTPGAAQAAPRPSGLNAVELPWLSQAEFDHLLWSASLNVVRGEDSFVRAQWAGQPFVWQPYPQSDGAHAAKLEAFLQRFLADAPGDFAADLRALWRGWNGLAPWPQRWPAPEPWRAACLRWRATLLTQIDLTTGLIGFCDTRR